MNKSQIEVNFLIDGDSFKIRIKWTSLEKIFDENEGKKLCKYLHQMNKLSHFSKWEKLRCQGSICPVMRQSIATNKVPFTQNISDDAFVFIYKARACSLNLRFLQHIGTTNTCRRCWFHKETMPHVFNHCPNGWHYVMTRHNTILRIIGELFEKKGF